MDPDHWDVFLEQYEVLKERCDLYAEALDYAIGKLGKQDMSEYIDEIMDIIKGTPMNPDGEENE